MYTVFVNFMRCPNKKFRNFDDAVAYACRMRRFILSKGTGKESDFKIGAIPLRCWIGSRDIVGIGNRWGTDGKMWDYSGMPIDPIAHAKERERILDEEYNKEYK